MAMIAYHDNLALSSRINVPTSCHLELKSLRTTCATTNVPEETSEMECRGYKSRARIITFVEIPSCGIVTKWITHKYKFALLSAVALREEFVALNTNLAWKLSTLTIIPRCKSIQAVDYAHRLFCLRYTPNHLVLRDVKPRLALRRQDTVNY